MNMTLVAATRFEISPAIAFLENVPLRTSDQWNILITGIGSTLATYAITKHILQYKPSMMIQAGIAGSYTDQYRPGSVVRVGEERMADLGVEENGVFKDVFDMKFIEPDEPPFREGSLKNPQIDRWVSTNLPAVIAVTVNEVTTNRARIIQLKTKYFCDTESMEGAAFHYACLNEHVPFLQLRAVSNFVGERDKNRWQLRESIEQLNHSLVTLITEITP